MQYSHTGSGYLYRRQFVIFIRRIDNTSPECIYLKYIMNKLIGGDETFMVLKFLLASAFESHDYAM
jgi:hypothetical protein